MFGESISIRLAVYLFLAHQTHNIAERLVIFVRKLQHHTHAQPKQNKTKTQQNRETVEKKCKAKYYFKFRNSQCFHPLCLFNINVSQSCTECQCWCWYMGNAWCFVCLFVPRSSTMLITYFEVLISLRRDPHVHTFRQ